jgi:hypothetical protein
MLRVISAWGVSSCQKLIGKDGNEVPFEGLYGPFRLVRSFGVRWHELVLDVLGDEVLTQAFTSIVVHDLKLDEVSGRAERTTSKCVCKRQ